MKLIYKPYILFFILSITFVGRAFAQPAGNDWINFSSKGATSDQSYYKIKIAKTGIYRIPVSVFPSGLSVMTKTSDGGVSGTVDGRRLQVFGRGVEQYIYLGNFSDSTFDQNGGYIEFYAQQNDGWLDARMYVPDSTAQFNPNQSLITDTATYFLTYNKSITNKRLQVQTDQSTYAASAYFMKTQLQQYKDDYAQGAITVDITVPSAEYTAGKGYVGTIFTAGSSIVNTGTGSSIYTASYTISGGSNLPAFQTPHVYTTGSDAPYLMTKVVGQNNLADGFNTPNHNIAISISSADQGTHNVDGFTFSNYDVHTVNDGLVVTWLSQTAPYNNYINIYTAWQSAGSPPFPPVDRDGVPYISLVYPHTYDFGGETGPQQMQVKCNSQAKTTLNITNYASTTPPILYDFSTHSKIDVSTVYSSGTENITALISNSGTGFNNCYLTDEQSVNTVTSVVPVNNGTGKFTNFLYSSMSNADYIIISNQSLWSSATAYKQYRATHAGGGYTPILVDVGELYDQFGYGIARHPLAIRNFVRFAYNNWTKKPPQYMLLFGKSVSLIGTLSTVNGNSLDNGRPFTPQNLVPTMGLPPSDMLLAARCNATQDITPVVGVGRISAQNNADAMGYLSKVEAYESATPDLWMKQIIHLAGGEDLVQQGVILSYLNTIKGYEEAAPYGGKVTTFYKNSGATSQVFNQTDSITGLVNNGVSIINFFGHSAGQVFDISLNNPRTYTNTGRYSFFMAMGCDAGAIHEYATESDRSNSEDYVLVPNKGSIAFLGTTALTELGSVGLFGEDFYGRLANTNYGMPIGYALQQAIKDDAYMAPLIYTNTYQTQILMEMTLEGDPSLKINTHQYPDIAVNSSGIAFNPGTVSTDLDSFTVSVNLFNIGRAFASDTFYVDLKRTFGDGSDTTYRQMQIGLIYSTTLTYRMPVNVAKGVGLNVFTVNADATNKINEGGAAYKVNNTASADLLITSDLLFPTIPPPYAIISKPTVTLKATTGNLLAASEAYTIQVDTTDLYTNPTTTTITQRGGIVSWALPITLRDSVVYYWRCSPAGKNKWKESSFTYINGKTGWSQMLNYQFKGDAYQNTQYNRVGRSISFNKIVQVVQIYTHGGPTVLQYADECKFAINSGVIGAGTCASNAFDVFVIDTATGNLMQSIKQSRTNSPYGCVSQFGSEQCGCHGTSVNYFHFPMYSSGNDSAFVALKKLIKAVPKGFYVGVYSIGNMNAKLFPADVVAAFQSIGATPGKLLAAGANTGYALLGRKGVGAIKEDTTSKEYNPNPSNPYAPLVEATIYITNKTGYVTTPSIGPTKNWKSLRWMEHPFETTQGNDSIGLSILGIDNNGVSTTLITKLTKDSTSVSLARINAAKYPYIQLRAYVRDTVLRTPPQISKWRVFYDPVTELAIDPNKLYSFYKDTLDEGDVVKLMTVVENISTVPSDSVRIKSWINDKNRVTHLLYNKRFRPLQPSGTFPDTTTIIDAANTTGYAGLNYLWTEVNPNFDQPEQTHTNNVLVLPFYVKADKINPLLDVTFDGTHILDKDIVSPKPDIVIKLKDNSKYLAVDTSKVLLWILPPGQTDPTSYRISSTAFQVTKPQLPNNNALEIDYKPVFPQDGIYTLIAAAADASNNSSGKQNYRISFEVINKSTITEILNYPNPFSTSTKFVFILTGADIPTQMKIQIMTISGKIVREITQSEIGPIHIGRNITDYAWDGKDQFGDQLANGVYIYRVITNIGGHQVEQRSTDADKYFVKGYGKMYLLR